MRISKSRLWLITGLVLHGLLIGGFALTLYPATYTAKAQFLTPDNERAVSFYNDLEAIDKTEIYDDVIKTLNLTQHPLINRALPTDNTKWSAMSLKIRTRLNKDLTILSASDYISKNFDHFAKIYADEQKATLVIRVRSPSPYLSQDIANAVLNTYRNHLRHSYQFKNYDPLTRSLSNNTPDATAQITVFTFPAGYIENSDPKPWNLILFISVLSTTLLGLFFEGIYRQR